MTRGRTSGTVTAAACEAREIGASGANGINNRGRASDINGVGKRYLVGLLALHVARTSQKARLAHAYRGRGPVFPAKDLRANGADTARVTRFEALSGAAVRCCSANLIALAPIRAAVGDAHFACVVAPTNGTAILIARTRFALATFEAGVVGLLVGCRHCVHALLIARAFGSAT